MSLRTLGHGLTAALAVVAFGAAGCGSKKKSSSTATPATKSAPAKSSSKASGGASVATKKYKAGQFCTTKKEAIYMSQHLTCKNKHLKKA
jgi:hypothetical protein